MKIDITGRQIEITPALREFTMEKLRKLEKLLDGPLDVHVVLAVEKHRHLAEIQVKSRTAVLSGAEETGDLYASIGEVADKLERQALKHKEKVTEKKRRDGTRAPEAVAALATSEEATGRGATEEEPPARILESRRYRLKPLAAEDAVMELEATGEDLLVYRDARTYRVNVVYRRKDGNFGLVDPEF
jgi:putative sigma-54 modulation protein